MILLHKKIYIIIISFVCRTRFPLQLVTAHIVQIKWHTGTTAIGITTPVLWFSATQTMARLTIYPYHQIRLKLTSLMTMGLKLANVRCLKPGSHPQRRWLPQRRFLQCPFYCLGLCPEMVAFITWLRMIW